MSSPDGLAAGLAAAGPATGGVAGLEVAVRRAGFAALLEGRAPTVAEMAAAAEAAESAVAAVVGRLVTAGRATATPDGRVDGIAGLTRRPTRHAIVPVPGGCDVPALATWCAFDAVAIPAALGWTAVAVTICGACGSHLRVPVEAGQPVGDAWGWLPPGECEHVLRDFCAAADLFCGRPHLDAWRASAGNPSGEPHSVAALAELGRAAWADCLPPRAP